MGQFCRRCNPKQRGPYPNIRANEHKWRPIGSNENMPWVVVTIPDELEKNGQPQNEKMKFETSKHELKPRNEHGFGSAGTSPYPE